MRAVFSLVRDDEAYEYGLAPWPSAWIVVRPRTQEARAILLEVTGNSQPSMSATDRA